MTRTCDLQVRNLTLYPTELWARTKNVSDPVFLTLLLATCQNSQLVSNGLGGFNATCGKPPARWGHGGESGIRTHGTLSGTRALQARAFSLSAISPLLRRLASAYIT